MREVDKNSWPCSYHVDAFASAWLWLSPTACCRVMLNSLSSRSTTEPWVGAACAGFPGPCHQDHPCSWPAGEHQVWRSASSGHASRRPQNGESSDLVSSGRGRAAPRPAAAWITAGRTWPCIQLRPRRLPAPTAPCIPHAPKTLTEPLIADLRRSPGGAQYAPRVVSKCVVKITWYRKVTLSPH